jgi:hypothetical protein
MISVEKRCAGLLEQHYQAHPRGKIFPSDQPQEPAIVVTGM